MLSKSVVALEKILRRRLQTELAKTCLFVSVLHSAKDSYLKKNHSGIFVQCSATAVGCKKGIKEVKKICTHCFAFAQQKYKPSPVTLFCYSDPAGTWDRLSWIAGFIMFKKWQVFSECVVYWGKLLYTHKFGQTHKWNVHYYAICNMNVAHNTRTFDHNFRWLNECQ